MRVEEQIIGKVRLLSPEQQQLVLLFIEYLEYKQAREQHGKMEQKVAAGELANEA